MRLDLSILPFLLLNLMGAKSYDFSSSRRESIFEKAQRVKVQSETTTWSSSHFTTISPITPTTTIAPTTPEVPKFETGVKETKKTSVSRTQVNINMLKSPSKEDVKSRGRKRNRFQYQQAGIPRYSMLASGNSEVQVMHSEDREVDKWLEDSPKDLVSVDSSSISTTSTTISPTSPKVPKFEPVVKKTKKNLFEKPRHERSNSGFTEDQVIHLNERQLEKLLKDSLLIKIKEYIASSIFPTEEVSELVSPSSGDATYDKQDLFEASTKILPSQDIEPDIYSAEDIEFRPISSNSLDNLSNRFVEPDANDLEFIPISSKSLDDLSSIVDQPSIFESPKIEESSISSVNVDNLSSEVITKLSEGQQNVKVKPGILTLKNKKPSRPRPSPIDTDQIENSTKDEDSLLTLKNKKPSRPRPSPIDTDQIENSTTDEDSLLTLKNKKPSRPRPTPIDTDQIENSKTDEDKSLKRQRTGLFSSKRRELVSSKQSSLITKSPVTASEITSELSKEQAENSSNDDKPKLKKAKTSLFSRNRDRSRKSPLKTTSNSNPSTRSYDSAPSTISTRNRGNSIPDSSKGSEKKDGLRKPTLFSKAASRNVLSSSKGNVLTSTGSSRTRTTTARTSTTRTTTTRSTTTRRTTTSTLRKIEINLEVEPLKIFYDLTSSSPSISTDVELVTTTIGPPIVESDTPVCPDNDSTFIIPHPDVCNAFYLCQKGVVSTRFCPDNFIFSLTQALCAPAQSGDCFGRLERRNVLLTTSTTVIVSTTTVLVSTTTTTSPVPGITCPDSVYNYIVPHPLQCDRFFICQKGIVSSRLCPDGFILSISQLKCVLPRYGHGDCDKRPRLQPASGTDPCVRQNGVFPTNSCTTFVTCRDNVPALRTCSEGTVYDTDKKVCDWTDAVLRPDCLPSDFLDFRCPNPILNEEIASKAGVRLTFGDHDRHPDPTDCGFYFICLTTGQPRRTGCGDGQVFSPTSKTCRPASEVPGCEAYFYR